MTTVDCIDAPLFANRADALGRGGGGGFLPAPLEAEIRRIYERSPLYRARFPLREEPLQWGCYREIPALSKQEIVERGHTAFFADYRAVERGLHEKRFEYESTSGTTAGPMTVIMEEGWWDAQTRRAYRAHPLLAPFADRPHRKCVLAPVGCSSNLCPYEDHPFPHRYFDGTVYLNLSSDPFVFPESEWDRIVVELQAVRPDILEGEPVYLSLLARAARKRGVSVPGIKAVILTYGKASLQHSRRVAEVFPAPQVDLYGSTEAGYIFVGGAFQDDSRVIDENAFVELAPWRGTGVGVGGIGVGGFGETALPAGTGANGNAAATGTGANTNTTGTTANTTNNTAAAGAVTAGAAAGDVFQILVTTRGREAMPLLRYHTGDIVRRMPAGGFRLLGRERDLFFREDGAVVSASEIDAAIPAEFRCWHHSLVQTGGSRWDFHYVADETAPESLAGRIAEVLGGRARVNAFRRRSITPAASGKFSLLKPL